MKTCSLFLPLSLLLSCPSIAADLYVPMTPEAKPIEANGWTFTVAPYFWMAGLSGDLAQFGAPTVSIDRSFSDILDDLDFGAMAIGEARYGRFSLIGDVMYTRISSGRGTPRGVAAHSADISSETFTGLFGAGYSVVDRADMRLDIVGGIRVWSVDTEISLDGGVLDGASFSDGATWVDGMAGIRGHYSIDPKVYLAGWGLIGGGAADVDWDVAGVLGYRLNDSLSALLGYRALGVDYSNDRGFVFDVVQQGPIIGLSMHF
ncbi:hypothetical protein [Mesorhizobium sp. L-8-3]|uniref:hypothetical protein n=1 Tax=Mesorhizobium sp. L-8-3 TaxID=2744522 RepID=UPI0019294751|nr:hypothetical protein [Mesorhizobium sp. L-8-3]BCH23947.1 hypothetical protein MesoLjLb_37320 [Mesorhizobium sp. L-8-3]